MYIGFDYGTANCSVAVMEGDSARMLPLEGDTPFIPSTLCAPTRESVSEYLYRFFKIEPEDALGKQLLRSAIAGNREEDIELESGDLLFGQAALDSYLADPEFVYYVKSPKSFLGASGLHDMQIRFFEDLVCAMMANIKQKSEFALQRSVSQTVIGRPVNFQGLKSELANQQAESILYRAAKRAGFQNIEFQFEPVAAGLDYESQLTEDKTVLVVDIGGGTTDCSLIRMGPSYRNQLDRQASLLSHSGSRVGGNDLDIHLAFNRIMPELGKDSKQQRGIFMPTKQFWNPIAINDVVAQTDFYMASNRKALEQLKSDAAQPDLLERLLAVYEHKLGYQLVLHAEQTKIAMSEQNEFTSTLDLAGVHRFDTVVDRNQVEESIATPVSKMVELIREALTQASDKPDVIYMTGGSARSPILRAVVESELPGIPVVSGNFFGSVTAGLARYAEKVFG
ncbi:molecular chaperone [Vibrio sp.]|uniref:Molecular chaperone n=1 Tax=Vibrio viridaestus TaxID=2487322 RepID=A0A3N9U095_9VIBR|nr:molecular chaperone [Vibrio viridaestus]MDC0612178.1 molecular chaperone [Vibrio sp.]RQW62652.1 molecular chaperone [Vibrio viridaestus]